MRKKPLKTDARRHHFIPQKYMLRFSVGKKLFAFDRKKRTLGPASVANTAVENDFNSVMMNDGSKDAWPEAALAEIDGAALQSMSKIEATDLTKQERFSIAFFAAFAESRGRGFRDALVVPELSQEDTSGFVDTRFAEAFSAMTGVWLEPRTIERLVFEDMKNVRSGAYEIGAMVERAFELAPVYQVGEWVVATAPDSASFITGDRPVALLKSDGSVIEDPLEPGAIKVLPLSSETALCFGGVHREPPPIQRAGVTDLFVRRVNMALAKRCDRFLVGGSKQALAQAARDAEIESPDSGGSNSVCEGAPPE